MRSSNINTDALFTEIGVLVQNRLADLLADYEDRFTLYESVYNHIASLNLSRIEPKRSEPTTNDVCNLVLEQLSELRLEVQSLKNGSSFVEVKKIPQDSSARENISLIIDDSSSELSSVSSQEELEEEEDELEEQEFVKDEEELEEEELVEDEDEDEDELEEHVEDEEEELVEDEEFVEDEDEEELEQVVDEQQEEQVIDEQQEEQVIDEQQEEQIVSSVIIEEDEDEEYTEIEIDGISYCTNDESNGFIYEVDDDGGVGKKVGYIKNEEPFFN